jgi:hypothetical protein
MGVEKNIMKEFPVSNESRERDNHVEEIIKKILGLKNLSSKLCKIQRKGLSL